MKFGRAFVLFKLMSLALRALIFFCVLLISNNLFGANHLMSFVSVVTVAGVMLGFGSADSLVVCREHQAIRSSRIVFVVSVGSIPALSLLLLNSYWINTTLACISFGLLQWNLGLIRRKNPVLFERISNFQMLIFWCLYLALLHNETPEFKILSFLYVALNGVIMVIASRGLGSAYVATSMQISSLLKVSVIKLAWQISYSSLTRMIFIVPNLATSMHAAFSYAYFLFEMTSALMSHYQTVFISSSAVKSKAWVQLSALILAINIVMLLALLAAIYFSDIFINPIGTITSKQPDWIRHELDWNDGVGLLLFMLAMSILQAVDFGRYAFKLEAAPNFVVAASVLTGFAFLSILALPTGRQLFLLTPLVLMLFSGISLMLVIWRIRCRNKSAQLMGP